jgi:hypothetical protein
VQAARVRKTLEYIHDRDTFVATLRDDISKLVVAAAKRNLTPAVRINGTSDQPQLALELASDFPAVQFYDYTKIPEPQKRTKGNYHLTLSYSGENLLACLDYLGRGGNVAVVFQGSLPETWHGYRVVDGDLSDLRFLDPKGTVVGLKTKGEARRMPASSDGFIQIGAAK